MPFTPLHHPLAYIVYKLDRFAGLHQVYLRGGEPITGGMAFGVHLVIGEIL